MLIDTHAHLNFKAFNEDYEEVILRAEKAQVSAIINVGSNLETSKKAIAIARKHKNIFAAIGLHPIHVKDEEFDEKYQKIATEKKVVAIGETGLDYYYNRDSADKQKEVFIKHINLANKLSKPLIIHSRDAGEDILSILTSLNPLPAGVFHCFSENWDFAQVILDMGFLLSFTGLITFSKNSQTNQVIENTPLEKIMIETDSPYLSPDPYRGKRNEPAYVLEVAKKIAEIKKLPLDIVTSKTTQNTKELFKLNS